jgi:magnesium-transporting ATPase (P-type)
LGLPAGLLAMAAFYLQYWLHGYWGVWTNLPDQGWIYQSATSMALAAVVMTQIGNLFTQRTEQNSIVTVGFFGNPMIWWGIATEVTLLVLIVYVPFFQNIFGTAAFALQNWLILITFIPVLLIIDEGRKWLLRRKIAR